jgi:hypothetical protein
MHCLEYPLFRSQLAVLQSVQRRIERHPWFVGGTLPVDKLASFVDKMHTQYHCLLTDQERSVLRKAGFPATFLVIHPEDFKEEKVVRWVLLSSGALPNEALKDARVERLLWRHYVLVQNRFNRWTWRLAREYRQDYQAKMLDAARRRDTVRMNVLLSGLKSMPMFQGVREDVKELVSEAKYAWGTSRASGVRHFFKREPEWLSSLPVMRPVRFWDDPPVTLGQFLQGQEVGQ